MIGKVNNDLISIRIQRRNHADDKPLRRYLHPNGWPGMVLTSGAGALVGWCLEAGFEAGGLVLDAGDDPTITATRTPIPEDAIKGVVAVFVASTADADVVAIGSTMAGAKGIVDKPKLAFEIVPNQQHDMATTFILYTDHHWNTLAQR
jgi:hypothetical protein